MQPMMPTCKVRASEMLIAPCAPAVGWKCCYLLLQSLVENPPGQLSSWLGCSQVWTSLRRGRERTGAFGAVPRALSLLFFQPGTQQTPPCSPALQTQQELLPGPRGASCLCLQSRPALPVEAAPTLRAHRHPERRCLPATQRISARAAARPLGPGLGRARPPTELPPCSHRSWF